MSARRYRFPGMDPWLEAPSRWQSVHDRLIVYLADELAGQVAPKYSARPGQRVVVEELEHHIVPDVVVTQGPPRPRGPASTAVADLDAPTVVRLPSVEYNQPFLEIRDHESGGRVVTVVEVLSPSNKRAGSDARAKYLEKQSEVLASGASLVEVDLLRGGEHTIAIPPSCLVPFRPFCYVVLTRRADHRDEAEVFAVPLANRLPRLRIPLVAPDADARVDLQAAVERAYELGAYDQTIDYAAPTEPPLGKEDAAWARGVFDVAAR